MRYKESRLEFPILVLHLAIMKTTDYDLFVVCFKKKSKKDTLARGLHHLWAFNEVNEYQRQPL